jgi:rfaE bifunctional protein kinase chain/domain/rfaE bifunctional protein nucleotidyltransferase chain/domain
MQTTFHGKIVSLDRLLSILGAARAERRTIVQCHGCFDIVHPGHIRYLEFAKRQGDLLVVTLTGDSEISKHEDRPYIPQELRAENLAALMCVDCVYVDPKPTAEDILSKVRPDVYVKGREYEGSNEPGFLAERRIVEGYGGRIIFSSGEIVFSSSKLIEQMPRTSEMESHRLNLLCKRRGIRLENLASILEDMRDLHVLIVGDIVIDRYVFCDALGVANEAPMMSLAQLDEFSYVGGAAIVARHVAAMGARPFLLSAAGQDEATQRIRATLEREGVDLELLEARPDIVEKTRFLVGDDKLFKVDRAQRLPLDTRAERRAAMQLEQRAKVADAVIFCDFGYGTITGGLLSRVLPSLRQNVRFISADVSGGRANLLPFKNVDLMCPTEREVRTTLNDYDTGLSAAAWQILNHTQARHLIVTLEKRGLVVFQRRSQDRSSPEWSGRLRSEQLPAFAEHATDRLGCGDALLAATTLALTAGADLFHAAYLGNAAAAVEIGMLGNHPVSAQTLHDWLKGHRELQTAEEATSAIPVPVGI